MAPMKWHPSMSVGVPLIDTQHQAWIEHLNAVLNAIETRRGAEHIAKTLDFLVSYTHTHFATEEKHMVANAYPGLAEHVAKHAELKQTLAELVQEFREDGASHPLATAVSNFLNQWLLTHIRTVDSAFGAFVKEKGIVLPKDG